MQRGLRLAGLVLLLAIAPPAGAAAPTPASDEAVLRELKTVLWPRAYREQDTALLDRLLDDRFQMIDQDGVVTTKADELAWIRNNRPSYDRFEYRIERLDLFDGDTAVVSGMGEVHASANGTATVTRYRSTNVLVKRAGQWRAVASQVAVMPAR